MMTAPRGLAKQADPEIMAAFYERERQREEELTKLRAIWLADLLIERGVSEERARRWATYLRLNAAGQRSK